MIIERKDDVINLVEIKYNNTPYVITSKYMDNLEIKRHDYITLTKCKKSIHFTFITLNGLLDNTYAKEIQHSLMVDDLFI